jgi:hypothetical protein
MAYDFNADPNETNRFDPIPVGTYKLRIKIRDGGAGPDGMLKLSKSLNLLMLSLELTVEEGEHKGRKIWENINIELNEQQKGAVDREQWGKCEKAVRIGRSKLRDILNSAYGLRADDTSEEAQEKRRIESLQAFDGLTFYARVGVRSGNGTFGDRNELREVLTLDNSLYPKEAKTTVPIEGDLNDEIPRFDRADQDPPF